MEIHFTPQNQFPVSKSTTSHAKWFKQWVSQEVVGTGGRCRLLKWVNEATIKAIREKELEVKEFEPEPELTTEVLFLCSYEGCGVTFGGAGDLIRHTQTHGERQHICHYEGCRKKFSDGSKLKRHLRIHNGQRGFICPHEGCCKAFSLVFNLRAHMKTHLPENDHTCPYPDCGKSYAHESWLKSHIGERHEKITADTLYHTPPSEKPHKTPKSAGEAYGSASSDRSHGCPYNGCEKAYIHAYKLNLHLRREHPGHFPEENAKNGQPSGNEMDEFSDQDALVGKSLKQSSRRKPTISQPPSKVARLRVSNSSPGNLSEVEKHFPAPEGMFEEEDSEETEDEMDNDGNGWRCREDADDAETVRRLD